jgi:hypothetical protein
LKRAFVPIPSKRPEVSVPANVVTIAVEMTIIRILQKSTIKANKPFGEIDTPVRILLNIALVPIPFDVPKPYNEPAKVVTEAVEMTI